MHNKRIPCVSIILLTLFFIVSLFITVKYAPGITKMLSEPARFRDWIHSFGYSGILVFIFFQIFQVVIATIPGEVVQIAGGYIYGVWLGTLYLVIGVIIGSIIVFYASRLLGYPLIKVFVRQDKLTLLYSLIRNQKADLALFILFLVPGLPKDILSYIAGLTPVKPLRFFVIATLGRSPALFVSAYIGSNLHAKNYLAAVILSSIAIILIFVGFLYKDRFITKIHIIFSSHKS
ncbi:hypothetical protein DESME_00490 [Desulfitobacterium metallireducens DSM 15288]|uniref:TVP38/TMEM64 family membrane protein n=2 Tax=Desulfitobacterium TaxID=36853 RepID=W0E4T6_9FIRM|nr:hypothetical protein DESME_00490 [Desulfitobacterium metallireducens DSM 15288]